MVKNFNDIVALARQNDPIKIIVAAAQDESVLRGVHLAKKLNLIEVVLVGDRGKIADIINKHDLNFDDKDIIDIKDERQACYKAFDMALAGKAEAVMKGKMDSGNFLGIVFDKKTGIKTDRLVSNVCLLEDARTNRLLYLTDAVVNTHPNLQQKVEIVKNAVEFVKVMGIDKPKVAAISATEFVTQNIPSTIDAACLSKMADRGQIQNAIVDGPLALDSVLSFEAARKKGINSPLCGEVDILLAPNIETANVIFKMWTHFVTENAIGVFLGTKVQTIQLPRESPPEAKLVGIATTALMLKERRKNGQRFKRLD